MTLKRIEWYASHGTCIWKLHGALQNWVDLQNDGRYDCFYFVADWHALTSDYGETGQIGEYTSAMVVDWLSAGLNPEKSTLFVQSRIKEHAVLFLLLSMITPVAWLERNPTYKEMKAELTNRDLSNLGFLAYPVLQAADIIMYKAYGVPVGIDQSPHVELTREIARRFNYLYGEIFPEPKTLLTDVPKLLGTDGRKISKSYDNAIYIGDQGQELQRKVTTMFTDPQRQTQDPGGRWSETSLPFTLIYSVRRKPDRLQDCRKAAIGMHDCKALPGRRHSPVMAPTRSRREYNLSHPDMFGRSLQKRERPGETGGRDDQGSAAAVEHRSWIMKSV